MIAEDDDGRGVPGPRRLDATLDDISGLLGECVRQAQPTYHRTILMAAHSKPTEAWSSRLVLKAGRQGWSSRLGHLEPPARSTSTGDFGDGLDLDG
jgi:hypothetical protein